MTSIAGGEKEQKFSRTWSLNNKLLDGKYIDNWLGVEICKVREEMTQTGSNYMSVYFRSTDKNDPWEIRHSYFNDSQVISLFKAVKVSHVDKPSDLEGKALEIRLAHCASRGREYPKVVSYRQEVHEDEKAHEVEKEHEVEKGA